MTLPPLDLVRAIVQAATWHGAGLDAAMRGGWTDVEDAGGGMVQLTARGPDGAIVYRAHLSREQYDAIGQDSEPECESVAPWPVRLSLMFGGAP